MKISKKWMVAVSVVVLLALALCVLPVHGEKEIYSSVIRLHVLANSDSEHDQALKLYVRDAVLADAADLLADCEDKASAEALIAAELPRLKATAARAVEDFGDTQAVSVSFGMEKYPTREYENFAFPAGEYLSLRVLLGDAAGQNWWCVLFPPLCLSAATAKEDAEEAFLAAGLTGEQYRIITDTENTKYKLRFKFLEMAQSLFA